MCEHMSFGLAGDTGQVDAQPAKVPLLAQGASTASVCVSECVYLCVCACMHVVITFSLRACMFASVCLCVCVCVCRRSD